MGIAPSKSTIQEAVAVISSGKIQGVVIFKQKEDYVRIIIDIKGLIKNHKHGFHIHESGDLREGCKSCCAHYNPNNTEHSGLDGGHAGDLGNIKTDDDGNCFMSIKTDKFIVDDIHRLVTIRTGIVFNKMGGALAEFMKPAKLGAAAILGDGKQIVSWIHQQDLNRLILFALEQEQVEGVYNAVAPDPVSNAILTKAIAQRYHTWAIPFHVPSFILKIMLGEMSVEVLKSANVSASKILAAGFSFDFASMDEALDDLLISNWSARSNH